MIGEGARSVSTRFGTDATIKAEDIEAFIVDARKALGNETAEVVLKVDGLEFGSGHDLEVFLEKLRLETAPEEVEQ